MISRLSLIIVLIGLLQLPAIAQTNADTLRLKNPFTMTFQENGRTLSILQTLNKMSSYPSAKTKLVLGFVLSVYGSAGIITTGIVLYTLLAGQAIIDPSGVATLAVVGVTSPICLVLGNRSINKAVSNYNTNVRLGKKKVNLMIGLTDHGVGLKILF